MSHSKPCQSNPTSPLQFLNHLLDQCRQSKNLKSTKIIHAQLLRTGSFFLFNLHPKLIFSYATCPNSNLISLPFLFNSMPKTNPIPWNQLISTFSHHSLPFFSLYTLSLMHKTALPLDNYALCSALTASASSKALTFGKNLHAHVSKSGWSSSIYVSSALVDLYAKSSSFDDAANLFDEIPVRNTVCANALLSGYSEAGLWMDGLQLVRNMNPLRLEPDSYTLSAALRACAGLSAIELGRQVHGFQVRRIAHMGSDVCLLSSLIEMYGRCGLVRKARWVFDMGGERRDVVLWTSMLGAYGRNGNFEQVIEMYKEMLMQGTKPDSVVFVTVLAACSHTGHLSRGLMYFESMGREFGLLPQPEHYSCVVDMLCRAGELDKAWELLNEMNSSSSVGVSAWGALLSACGNNGKVEMGRKAAQKALELDPGNAGIYVLLSNLYAGAGMWEEIGKLRELMNERGLRKDVGCSRIESTKTCLG
eukprot:TRINITY_DN39386_c1_g1_i1.p1 TRINITY_DN39386_c1_g1~~TRINITY_DN39386_c1_g1_i1.p1  ORF type:complete len:476 (-),score=69.57 TRINITY_DN39386_c1_g1_i1:24-1451(-)